MKSKYIRPNELVGNTRLSRLVQKRQYISEEEYKEKVHNIIETLNSVINNFNKTEEILNADYATFMEHETEINRMTNEIIVYIDNPHLLQ